MEQTENLGGARALGTPPVPTPMIMQYSQLTSTGTFHITMLPHTVLPWVSANVGSQLRQENLEVWVLAWRKPLNDLFTSVQVPPNCCIESAVVLQQGSFIHAMCKCMRTWYIYVTWINPALNQIWQISAFFKIHSGIMYGICLGLPHRYWKAHHGRVILSNTV